MIVFASVLASSRRIPRVCGTKRSIYRDDQPLSITVVLSLLPASLSAQLLEHAGNDRDSCYNLQRNETFFKNLEKRIDLW